MDEKEIKDIQTLITMLLPLAEEFVAKYRELHPFAGATTHAGEFVSVGSHSGHDGQSEVQLIESLKQSLRQEIKDFLVVAVFYDVRTKDTVTGAVSDAIAVFVEHRDGSNAYEFFYPYVFSENALSFDESYGNTMPKEIFPGR